MQVDLLVHVEAGQEIAFHGFSGPFMDGEMAILGLNEREDARQVEATNLHAGGVSVPKDVVQSIRVQLAGDDLFEKGRT